MGNRNLYCYGDGKGIGAGTRIGTGSGIDSTIETGNGFGIGADEDTKRKKRNGLFFFLSRDRTLDRSKGSRYGRTTDQFIDWKKR